MVYLILAIICGASLAVCFKLFRKLGIDTLQGVFFNYIVAIIVSLALSSAGAEGGSVLAGAAHSIKVAATAPWTWLAVIEGLLFMGGILVLAASTQRSGVALTNVSARASLALTVIACWLMFDESAPNWLAIAMVLVGMYLIFGNVGSKAERSKFSFKDSWLPLAVFAVYGACDILLKGLKVWAGKDGNQGNIMLFIFGTACIFCIITYLVRGNFKQHPFSWKAIVGGVILGLFNSGCTAFMLKALGTMDAGIFYPIYNVGVVVASLLIGVLFFKEKIRTIQLGGIILAAAAIVLLLV